MSILTTSRNKALAVAAALIAMTSVGSVANAGAVSAASGAATVDQTVKLEPVRYRGGGIGIYIDPSYGYGYDYGPRRYGYYPRYRSSRYSYYGYDGYYDRPYRRHGHRWAQERFKHPLGRR